MSRKTSSPDFRNDYYGRVCLEEASKGKSQMRFGAVLVKDGVIIGKGWNRLAKPNERTVLGGYVDYAIHAEQAAIYDALQKTDDLSDAYLYVLGESNAKQTRGNLSVRDERSFTCYKCAHTLQRFGVTVIVPTITGWEELTPDEALASAKTHKGYWTNFVKGTL